MRRVLSTLLAVALLLGLGVLAVLGLPNANALPAVSAAAPEFNPDAPTVPTIKWTDVSVPLKVKIDGTDAGTDNNADEVAAYIQSSCSAPCPTAVAKVARWRNDLQAWEVREVGTLFGGENFVVKLGDSLLISADSTLTAPTLSWVGDVPDPGENPSYTIGVSKWTSLMIPLDQSIVGAPATADQLAGKIGLNVTKVGQWREDLQGWEIREVGTLFGGENFAVQLGYPYLVYSTSQYTWP